MTSIAIIGRGRLGAVAVMSARSAGWGVRRIVTNKIEPAWDVAPTGRVLSDYAEYKWPRIPVDRSGDWRKLIGEDVDLILSVLYDRVIGADLIYSGPRVLNLHMGMLPEFRGMRPNNWALARGDQDPDAEHWAGVTLHEVDERLDTGPIVAQARFSIFPAVDEVRDVYRRAIHAAEGILRHTLPIVDQIKARPQVESNAHYYSGKDIPLLGNRSNWTRETS